MAEETVVTIPLEESFERLDHTVIRSGIRILFREVTDAGREELRSSMSTSSGDNIWILADDLRGFRKTARRADAIKRRIVRFIEVQRPTTTWNAWSDLIAYAQETSQAGPPTKSEADLIRDLCDVDGETLLQIEGWGLENQVHETLQLVKQTFQSLHGVKTSISTDPEIAERKRVRITLSVSGSPEQVFEEETHFKKKWYSTVDLQACEVITMTYKWKN